jgi:hypothetical protein
MLSSGAFVLILRLIRSVRAKSFKKHRSVCSLERRNDLRKCLQAHSVSIPTFSSDSASACCSGPTPISLAQMGFVRSAAEREGVSRVLNAAAWTYVAAFITSLVYFLSHLLPLLTGRDRG